MITSGKVFRLKDQEAEERYAAPGIDYTKDSVGYYPCENKAQHDTKKKHSGGK